MGDDEVVLPGANTSDPAAPFFVDLAGVDGSTTPPTRATPPPGATALPDGALPGIGETGSFVVGPTHAAAPETEASAAEPAGTWCSFTMSSAESVVYGPGIVRHESSFNAAVQSAAVDSADRSHLVVTASRPGPWSRTVTVYVPAAPPPTGGYPFVVVGDGELAFDRGRQLATVLDRLVDEGRLPPLVAVLIGSGGQDAQGSQRGREYDTVSGTFAHWVDREVLPLVEREAGIGLTRDPDGRGAVGFSSSGVAGFTMAWFRPDLFRRVAAWSPTFVNQQWPHDPSLPGGAWQYHSAWPGPEAPTLGILGFGLPEPSDERSNTPLVLASDRKPIRFWFQVGDRDLFYPVPQLADGMHDWVLANVNMANALAAKGYEHQFVLTTNAEHVDRPTIAQTLPLALEWMWHGYPDRPVS